MLGKIDALRASLAELLIEFAELLIAVGVKASELTGQMWTVSGDGVELGEFQDRGWERFDDVLRSCDQSFR